MPLKDEHKDWIFFMKPGQKIPDFCTTYCESYEIILIFKFFFFKMVTEKLFVCPVHPTK